VGNLQIWQRDDAAQRKYFLKKLATGDIEDVFQGLERLKTRPIFDSVVAQMGTTEGMFPAHIA
jgi:hypothetical protein